MNHRQTNRKKRKCPMESHNHENKRTTYYNYPNKWYAGISSPYQYTLTFLFCLMIIHVLYVFFLSDASIFSVRILFFLFIIALCIYLLSVFDSNPMNENEKLVDVESTYSYERVQLYNNLFVMRVTERIHHTKNEHQLKRRWNKIHRIYFSIKICANLII